ncbi:MAG: cyclophane-forming radical SAM/SPASM peptide maturase GrrM/OscB [Hyphomicrobiaceae bacterium]|nr:cyclophane-forming radical SAM/SPASM peptide maturase GrrM/OscB [Hyphomicrobiaceae bacterium]
MQPTPFCNIDCSYCYLPNRSSKKRLSFDLAETVFRKLFSFPTIREAVTLVWHAGEPLVLPTSYYERMFVLIQNLAPRDLQIRHSFQTNGTLISETWCELIKAWQINVGVSIDGPKEFHNRYRKGRNGAGSFDRAFAGLQKLQRAGIPCHVISVLTLESLRQPDRLFDFYVDNAIDDVCFNIEEQEGTNAQSKFVGNSSANSLYWSFLRRFVELTIERKKDIFIREIESSLHAIRGHGSLIRNEQAEPFRIISVDCDGNISTFSPELLGLRHELYGSFSFGNLVHDSFEDISARVLDSRLYADIRAGIRECSSVCAYYGVCGGGAPSNKIYENGSAASTETAYCRAFMSAIDIVLDLTERLPPELTA